MEKVTTTYYRYPLGLIIWWRLGAILCLAVGLYVSSALLLILLFAIAAPGIRFPFEDRAGYAYIALVSSLIGVVFLNSLPEIGVNDEGLLVKVFLVKWVFVPWENVLDLRLSPISVLPRASQMYLLQVRGLAPFRFFSLMYYTGWKAGIPVSSQIQGFDELLQTIEEHLGRSNEEKH